MKRRQIYLTRISRSENESATFFLFFLDDIFDILSIAAFNAASPCRYRTLQQRGRYESITNIPAFYPVAVIRKHYPCRYDLRDIGEVDGKNTGERVSGGGRKKRFEDTDNTLL